MNTAQFGASSASSIDLGRVFGIRVRLHLLFLLLVPLAMMNPNTSPLGGLVMLLVTFGSVFLHELGHSLAAKHYGIRVVEITLWPLGGMAKMESIPEDSRIEGVVALAGPAVNVVLALLGAIGFFVFQIAGLGGLAFGAIGFAFINAGLGIFNMIPIFPMDGGRVLRAWLARKRDWVRATEIAVDVGRKLTLVGLVLGFFFALEAEQGFGLLCILPLIAGFLWLVGSQELWAVRLRHGHSPFGTPPGFQPEPDTTTFYDGSAVPHGTRRPAQPGRSTGFSDEEIAELERFRGRLERRDDHES